MATDSNMLVSTGAPASSAASRRRAGAWLPTLPDIMFLALLAWLFAAGPFGWVGLLSDGDTGWHIRTGEYILDQRAVPAKDLFSFSRPGEAWFAWEWGADVIFALLFRAGGLKLLTLASGTLICLTLALLFLRILRSGVNLLIALPLVALGTGAASIHYLARPHVFTLLFLCISLWLIEYDRGRQTKWLWLLVPLTALWTNLHGGFLALIVCLALLTAGTAAEVALGGGERAPGWLRVRRYAALTGACAAATFLNPYGYQLHVHVARYLNSDWIKSAIQEFQPPTFRDESSLQYEVLLVLGIAASALLLSRRRVVAALWVLAWAHFSLSGARHIPIYVIAALPVIAAEVNSWWDSWTRGVSRKSVVGILRQLSADMLARGRRFTVFPAVVVILLPLLDQSSRWPRDFPVQKFPVAMVSRHQGLLSAGRPLTTDQWGDYLIFRSYPRQRVYVDGRSDFFGQALGQEYLGLLNCQGNWRQVIEKWGFTVALVPPQWPLATALRNDPEWRLIDSDDLALLLVKRAAGEARRAPG